MAGANEYTRIAALPFDETELNRLYDLYFSPYQDVQVRTKRRGRAPIEQHPRLKTRIRRLVQLGGYVHRVEALTLLRQLQYYGEHPPSLSGVQPPWLERVTRGALDPEIEIVSATAAPERGWVAAVDVEAEPEETKGERLRIKVEPLDPDRTVVTIDEDDEDDGDEQGDVTDLIPLADRLAALRTATGPEVKADTTAEQAVRAAQERMRSQAATVTIAEWWQASRKQHPAVTETAFLRALAHVAGNDSTLVASVAFQQLYLSADNLSMESEAHAAWFRSILLAQVVTQLAASAKQKLEPPLRHRQDVDLFVTGAQDEAGWIWARATRHDRYRWALTEAQQKEIAEAVPSHTTRPWSVLLHMARRWREWTDYAYSMVEWTTAMIQHWTQPYVCKGLRALLQVSDDEAHLPPHVREPLEQLLFMVALQPLLRTLPQNAIAAYDADHLWPLHTTVGAYLLS